MTNDSKTEAAVAALDALDVSGELARDRAETILLGLVPESVQRAYGRYVRREDEARGRGVEWTVKS